MNTPDQEKDFTLIKDRSNEQNNRNTNRWNKAVGWFGVKPVRQQKAGLSPSRVLAAFGFQASGEIRDEYIGRWEAVVNDSSDYTLPAGWSMTGDTGTATYVITHNLNNDNYLLFVSPDQISPRIIGIEYALNTVTVAFENDSGTKFVTPARFLLINIV